MRFWSKLKDNTTTTLRALGLNIIRSLNPQNLIGKKSEERVKIAIRHSRTTAVLRALIHVIPVGVSLWEVVLNWNTYYVGSFKYNQIYYQFGAKAHEITIQASLATIVFSYIRHEMAIGQGLPFGALFSGLQINQISYLWSMELWGSIGSKSLTIRRKLAMLAVIVVCFVLAAAAGPSSAILLIPRLDYWPAGSAHVWVNASADDIWPQR